MLYDLSGFIKKFSIIVIFFAVIYSIIPKDKTGKTVSLIFSIIVSILIISPFLNLKFFSNFNGEIIENVDGSYVNYIENKKINLIKNNVKNFVNSEERLIDDVEIDYEKNENDFNIKSVTVFLDKNVINNGEENIIIIDKIKSKIQMILSIGKEKVNVK